MAEEQTSYSKFQSLVLDKILSQKESSTTVLCADDTVTAQMRNFERYLNDKRNDSTSEEFKKVEEELFKIYQENTYCAHCGKKAIVSGSLKELKLSCDCDGAKSEITDKLAIKEESKKLDDRFFEVQKAAINKAFGVYKIHYAENVKKRDEELKKFDEEIMNIASI